MGLGRVLIVGAEYGVHRPLDASDHVADRHRMERRCSGIRRDGSAPTVDRRVDLVAAACEQQGRTAAHAKANRANLAAAKRHAPQQRGGAFDVAYGQAIFELGRTDADLVYRLIGADFDTRETIGHQHDESDVGEAPRDVARMIADAEDIVQDDDARVAAALARTRKIAGNFRTFTRIAHLLRGEPLRMLDLTCYGCHFVNTSLASDSLTTLEDKAA